MARLSMTKDLYTGSPLIDGDHERLVALLNVLFDAMESAKANGVLRKAMADVVAYTKEHFRREEAEMERIEYVALLAHQYEHAKLINQIVELKAILDSGGKINVPAVSDFLREWLCQHIVTADSKLAAALKREKRVA